MNPAALQRRCEARLRELPLPDPFDLGTLCVSLSARRGRAIRLHPVRAPLGPCGLWVASDEADYIFYEEGTSALHQRHIILHELSHLVCGHGAPTVAHTELLRLLLPDVGEDAVRRVLARGAYLEAEEEQEAELLASLILARATGPVSPAPVDGAVRASEAEVARVLARLEASLGAPEAGRP